MIREPASPEVPQHSSSAPPATRPRPLPAPDYPATKRPRRWGPLLFGALLVGLAVLSGGLLGGSGTTAEEELDPDELRALLAMPPEPPVDRPMPVVPAATGTASLVVTSAPEGAEVLMDARPAGTTPLRLDRLPSQWYLLTIERPGLPPLDTLVFLEPERVTTLDLALTPPDAEATAAETTAADAPPETTPAPVLREEPARPPEPDAGPPAPAPGTTGALRITSTPARAAVTLDGQPIGLTPLDLDSLAAGSYAIVVSHPGYERATYQVDIEPDRTQLLAAQLARQHGTLSVVVRPWGSIYIDGVLRARDTDVRYETTLPAGPYELRVVHPALGEWARTVEVEPGLGTDVVVDLNASRR